MNKRKVLFITGKFHPVPTANTINTKNIIKEMQARGHKITCIAINQDEGESFAEYDSIPVYSIKSTKYGKLNEMEKEGKNKLRGKIALKILFYLRKVKNLINLFKFPDVDPSQSKAVYRLVEKLHKEENYDCIIGVFRPFSGVSAVISMKKKYPEVLCGAYYLDLINGSTKPAYAPRKLYEKLCYEGEIKAFKRLDMILMAKGGKAIYSNDKYKSVNSKIRYIDFPVFTPKKNEQLKSYEKPTINLVYAGTLNKNYRNPTYMLQMLEKLSRETEGDVLDIYGRGNCDSIIKRFQQDQKCQINVHGMVSHDYVISAMQEADFIINISNSTQNIIPSKIFELFSTGKPIINFVSNKNDISKEYFDVYPSVCTILEWENSDKQVKYLKDFIVKEKGNRYPIEQLKERYIENTPEFTVNIIEEYLQCVRGRIDD